jgi:hypothetical protein
MTVCMMHLTHVHATLLRRYRQPHSTPATKQHVLAPTRLQLLPGAGMAAVPVRIAE